MYTRWGSSPTKKSGTSTAATVLSGRASVVRGRSASARGSAVARSPLIDEATLAFACGMTRAMAGDVALMRYHEIVLKGRNRPYFVRRLAEHVARLVVDLPVGAVNRASSRLLLPVHDVACWPELRARLSRVFGLANFALAVEVPLGPRGGDPIAAVARLGEMALARLRGRRPESFRVVTKRSDKLFALP